MGAPTRLIVARGHSIPILVYPSELPEARAGRQASVRPRSRMSHAGSAVGTARTRAVPRQPARMVLRFADLDRSSTCSLPSVGLHRPASRESRLAVPAAGCTRTAARQLHRRSVPCADAGRRTGQTMGLISKEVPPEPPVRPGGRRTCPRRLGAAHASAHRPHWPPCRSAAPTQSKRSRGFRCTRTGQRLANAEAAAAGAQRYRAGTAPSPRST